MFKLAFASLISLVAVASISSGCADEITAAYDCNKICDRYKECFDADYDDGACASRCQDDAGSSEAYDDKASACEDCIDDKSCTGSFSCVDECGGIVP